MEAMSEHDLLVAALTELRVIREVILEEHLLRYHRPSIWRRLCGGKREPAPTAR